MSMRDTLYIEDVCPICQEHFGVDRQMWNVACGHVFCGECVVNFDPRVCPLCREDYAEDDIECLGPWEEQDSWGQGAEQPREEDWAPDGEGREEDWVPGTQEREEDRDAWSEIQRRTWDEDSNKDDDGSGYAGEWEAEDEGMQLGYTREWSEVVEALGDEENGYEREWTADVDEPAASNWMPSDDALEEDRAAWEEFERQREWVRGQVS